MEKCLITYKQAQFKSRAKCSNAMTKQSFSLGHKYNSSDGNQCDIRFIKQMIRTSHDHFNTRRKSSWARSTAFLNENYPTKMRRKLTQDYAGCAESPKRECIVVHGTRWKVFPPGSGIKQGGPLSPALEALSKTSTRLQPHLEVYLNQKGRGKNLSFANNIILFVDNPKISHRKPVRTKNRFGKVTRSKINSPKSAVFICTKSRQAKRKERYRVR